MCIRDSLDAAHVSVQGGVAHAVRNDHIVAVGAGPLGDDDCARLGGVHRTGVTHPADVGALVVGGANAAGRITPAYGGGDIPAVHRPDICLVYTSLPALWSFSRARKSDDTPDTP